MRVIAAFILFLAGCSDNPSSMFHGCGVGPGGYATGKCQFNDYGATRKKMP